jgi:DNA-binding LacI/PurR family transcriptional regulator
MQDGIAVTTNEPYVNVVARDVARIAGVSVSTVSRALARPTSVASATRVKVLDAARELGYHPKPAARTVSGTGSICLLVPALRSLFFASIVDGVHSRALAGDYNLFVTDSQEDPSQEPKLVRRMAKLVDGVLLCSPRASDEVLAELAKEVTLVLINRRSGEIPAVTIDNVAIVRQALDHLWALGHNRIAYVGTGGWANSQRRNAFLAAREDYPGIELVDVGSFGKSVSGGSAAADLVLATGATATLAYNDEVAYGLLERFRLRGVVVPDDMSVVGIDDNPISDLMVPSLTTVAQPIVALGRAGVDMLLSLVSHPHSPPTHFQNLSVQLVVRGSTGPRREMAAPRPA